MKLQSSLAAIVVTLVVAGPAAAVRVPSTDGPAKPSSAVRHAAAVAKQAKAKDARPKVVRYLGRH
jgi:hypothetical protein